ncbi:MAG: hypothetical protein ACHQ0J_15845 [Candidatus Dormibacterales bacterium]
MSRRKAAVLGFVNALWASAFTLAIGPTYLAPLPMWAKLLLVFVGCCLIATIAIYSRRRSRRKTSSP